MATAKKSTLAAAPEPVVLPPSATIEASAAAPAGEEVFTAAIQPFAVIHEQVRHNAEKGLDQVRAQYAVIKDNAEKATDKLEQSFTAVHTGSRSLTQKAIEAFRANSNATFDHVQALFAVRTAADAIRLQQDFVKSQVETLQAQSREMTALMQQVASEISEPVKAALTLPMSRA